MLSKLKIVEHLNFITKDDDIESMLQKALRVCDELALGRLKKLGIYGYEYDVSLAVAELGLDEELVNELVDDYVAQVIKSVVQFEKYLTQLLSEQKQDLELDYTLFRELAHKNLGVARNLRIKNAETLLYELMKQDDLEYLLSCLEALKYCAIKLRVECAYKTIKLINLKSSL